MTNKATKDYFKRSPKEEKRIAKKYSKGIERLNGFRGLYEEACKRVNESEYPVSFTERQQIIKDEMIKLLREKNA